MKEDAIFIFIIIFLTSFFNFILGYIRGSKLYRDKAIKAGVAYYNPTNSKFTWKTNLVEKESKNE